MKKTELRKIIREEIQNLSEVKIRDGKKYTIDDLYEFLKEGIQFMISTNGGESGFGFNPYGKPTKYDMKNFESRYLNNKKYKNKKFIASKLKREWMFILEGSIGDKAAADFYDKMQTRSGGGIYKGD